MFDRRCLGWSWIICKTWPFFQVLPLCVGILAPRSRPKTVASTGKRGGLRGTGSSGNENHNLAPRSSKVKLKADWLQSVNFEQITFHNYFPFGAQGTFLIQQEVLSFHFSAVLNHKAQKSKWHKIPHRKEPQYLQPLPQLQEGVYHDIQEIQQ